MGEKTQGGITMPNKDSFTFSDKLRKSKSVPLSKRLPSIVGGQTKQKRTLVQRAQRDLPFILVAALALLLLPFLSRTGSEDVTTDIHWPGGPDNQEIIQENPWDVTPYSMKDPMDLILRPRSDVEGSGVTMGTEADKSAYGSSRSSGNGYGYGDGDGSSYSSRYSRKTSGSTSTTPDYKTRNKYDEQYTTRTTKKPATAAYGKTTRPAVRKSFERKGTDINRALRISQMPGNKGTTGVGHALPLGQGPTRGSGTAFREGIRPIALQPMESRGGIGRSMEGMRAEADRSIREMNAGGPAKANLLAAQMRDVDGKPTGEGPGFGGPSAGGAASKFPSGGGPGNTNGYSVQKPWWWDMMQTRSQKMWDLLYYKPREIFWNNIYNYMSQLMNCLATGNKDGDVSTMFGKGAADSDFMCVKNGKEIMVRYNKQKPTSTSKDKDGNKTEELVDSNWFLTCDKLGGESVEKKKDAKSFLDVRLECVGLDVVVDWLKGITKHTKYDSYCEGVNGDPMTFTLDIERSNDRDKHNTRRENKLKNKTVIALLAKVTDGPYKGKEVVVYAERGSSLSEAGSDFARGFREAHEKCQLSRLVAFTSRKSSSKIDSRIDKYNKAYSSYTVPIYIEDDNLGDTEEVIIPEGKIVAANKLCGGEEYHVDPVTLDTIRNRAELGKAKKGSYAECEIWDKKPIFSRKTINDTPCLTCCERGVDIKERATFSATIANARGKQVHAVVVEQIDGESKAKVIYVANFRASSTTESTWCIDGTDTCKYLFTINVASLGFNPNEIGTKVRTDYPGGSSSSSSTDNTQANNKMAEGVTSNNTTAKDMLDIALSACEGITDDGEKTECINNAVNKYGPTTGSYQGNSQSSSDGSNLDTARGSGRIFWIVTKPGATLKVDMWQEIAKTLDDIYVSDLIDTNGPVMWDLCRYRWCNDIATCDLPKDMTNVCKAEDGKFYLYESIRLDGKYFNFPLDLLPNYKANGGEPNCDKFCKDKDENDNEVIVCPHRIIKLKDAMDLFPPGFTEKIPLCTPYCQYKGKVYEAMYVEETKEYYITNANELNLKGKYPECTPLAWSWRTGGNDFYVYRFMGDYDDNELPLTPNSLDSALKCTLGTHNTYTVNLSFLDKSEFFTIIRGQAIASGNPRGFLLFPKLELPEEIDVDGLDACTLCSELPFDNASVKVKGFESEQLIECLKQIQDLRNQGFIKDDELRSLYFYGYASLRGSHPAEELLGDDDKLHKIGCTTNKCTGKADFTNPDDCWAKCNRALSEDRSLAIIEELIKGIDKDREFNPKMDVNKEREWPLPTYHGFSNARPVGSMIDNATHRLNKKSQTNVNAHMNIDNPDFTFVSYPCGSQGANIAYNLKLIEQISDRQVVITPINDGSDYCAQRMTCDMAKKGMNELKEKIRERIKNAGITVAKPTADTKTTSYLLFGDSSDGEYISQGELAELMKEESSDPNANPQA